MSQSHEKYTIAWLNELEYKKILDTMTESIWMGDENERTIYANPNFCNLLGYTLEEMLWKESYIFWDEESIKTVRRNNAMRKDGAASKYEWLLKSKTGELIPVFLSGTPLSNGGTAGIMTDLREIEAVKQAAQHFEELNTIKDEFISMVGHELRTPMTGIKGYLSMIVDGDAGPITEQTQKFLQIVLKESNRLIDMINDMLDIAKLESGKMDFKDERMEALALWKEVYDNLTFLANERGINLKFEPVDCEGKYIFVDSAKIKQVLINLVGNALKFTKKDGTVTIRVSHGDEGIFFSVIDTWIGIPKKYQATIFEKFKQVDNYMQKSVAGTWLGLYICKKILSHSGANLSVISKEGKGSTFYFIVPVCK